MRSPRPLVLGFLAAAGAAAGAGAVALHEGAAPQRFAGAVVTPDGALPVRTTAAPAPAETADAAKIYARARESVVSIRAVTDRGIATGTGFVVSSDGTIVTNDHVIDGARQVTVRIGSKGVAQEATITQADASHDLAVLKVDQTGLTPLKLAGASTVTVGEQVFAIGSPYGLDETLTGGIVSATGRTIQGVDGSSISGAIQTDAALNPGNSGGPLLDADGDVIGVNSQIASSGTGGNVGVGFAIGADTVKALIS